MHKILPAVICFLLCITACIQEVGFKKEIPLSMRGTPYCYYIAKPLVEKKMGLNSIENGVKAIQIRIWYTYSFNDSSQLFILAKEASSWRAETVLFKYVRDAQQEGGYTIKILEKKLCNPVSGWSRFTNALFKSGITSLPDMNAIASYPDMTDGDCVIVEVAREHSYRIYEYKFPSFVQGVVKEARQMAKIIDLLIREFGFKPLDTL